jgi:uncharacterized repeat protein (TIGR03943 family)
MPLKTYRITQAVIMVALGLFLAEKIWSGALFWYINDRFLPLIVFSVVAAVALALGAWPRKDSGLDAPHDHDHHHADHEHAHEHAPEGDRKANVPLWGALILALPVLLGVLVPARPLGASAIDNKGLNTSAPLSVGASGQPAKLDIAPQDRTVLDWVRAFNYADDPEVFNQQPADVIGFVYRDDRLPAGHFMVSRFIVTCCAADASGVGMIVHWPNNASPADNTWVRVRGPVTATAFNGKPAPLVEASSVEVVPQPDRPYMYP